MLLSTKGFASYALDAVALVRFANVLFGHHQPQAGVSNIIGASEDQKIWMRCADRCIGKYSGKIRLIQQTLLFGKGKPLGLAGSGVRFGDRVWRTQFGNSQAEHLGKIN